MAHDLVFRPRSGLRRVPAGIAGLSFPTALVVAALGVDFRAVGDGSDIATAVLATLLFVIAAPTAWIFAIDFIEAGRFTVVFASIITSFPIWYLIGVKLGSAATHWPVWISAYLKLCVIWTVLWILLLQVVSLWVS
jgi:hypothetical protein